MTRLVCWAGKKALAVSFPPASLARPSIQSSEIHTVLCKNPLTEISFISVLTKEGLCFITTLASKVNGNLMF